MDEIFGEQNFIAQLVWEKGRKNDAKFFSVGHEYMLVYAKSKATLREAGQPGGRRSRALVRSGTSTSVCARHTETMPPLSKEIYRPGSRPSREPIRSRKWARYKRVDANGPWRDRDISWPGGDGPKYDLVNPATGMPVEVPEAGWRYSDPQEMDRQIKLGLVAFREDDPTAPPFRKAHLRPVVGEIAEPEADESEETEAETEAELATQVRGTYFYKQSQVAVTPPSADGGQGLQQPQGPRRAIKTF